jgi:CxC4 like cysteine cluster associated with KDZ transposases
MNSYTSHFTLSETPIHAFFQTIKRAYVVEQCGPFCSERTFLSAWFAFVRLQEIGSNMQCQQCGPEPSIIIADGISVSFPKHRVETLCPPTVANKATDLIRIRSRTTKSTCFIGPFTLRTQIQHALDEDDLELGKAKLAQILKEKV